MRINNPTCRGDLLDHKRFATLKMKTTKIKKMMITTAIFMASLMVYADNKVTLPASEWKVVREVAGEYGLSKHGEKLLAAIRLHENGLVGLEFGIGGPVNNGHPAHRFAQGVKNRHSFNEASFRCQAQWAAGTIKKRYRGDLLAFARIYCPCNAWKWYVGVSSLMYRLWEGNGNER